MLTFTDGRSGVRSRVSLDSYSKHSLAARLGSQKELWRARMASGMFVLKANGDLIPMTASTYDSEELLQRWLADYPELLAGEQINPEEPRQWMLIQREAGVPGGEFSGSRWSLDHLFVDQDGTPTFVEVKRSSDTRIRREVVGQMLDYAANGLKYWPIDSIKAMLATRCAREGTTPEAEIHACFGEDTDTEQYWAMVHRKFESGEVRLIFVSDEIPGELQAIVEFLNNQMERAEVFAVEIKQYVAPEQEGLVTLVPRLLGRSVENQRKKERATGGRANFNWDEESFFRDAAVRLPPEEVEVARTLFDWSMKNMGRMTFGRGKYTGSFVGVVETPNGSAWPIISYSSGYVEIALTRMESQVVFSDLEKRREYVTMLNTIEGFHLEDTDENLRRRSPSLKYSLLTEDEQLRRFIATLDWFIAQVA